MKRKLNRRMVLPLLYGVVVGWLVVGVVMVVGVWRWLGTPLLVGAVATSAILLLALIPALYRSAMVYSLALKYHRAEYLYDLGNGVEAHIARALYEKKTTRAVIVWLQQKMLFSSFGVVPIMFFVLLVAGVSLLPSLILTIIVVAAVVLALLLGMFVMLRSARHYCYDKFGNIRSN